MHDNEPFALGFLLLQLDCAALTLSFFLTSRVSQVCSLKLVMHSHFVPHHSNALVLTPKVLQCRKQYVYLFLSDLPWLIFHTSRSEQMLSISYRR